MTKPHLALLDMLGVTVANRRWSWGGYARDGSVVLVVWKDQVHPSGRPIAYTPEGGEASAGHDERLRHLQEIRSGRSGYFVVAVAVDPQASPRSVRQVVRLVYPIARVVEEADGLWTVERGEPVAPEEWKRSEDGA